MQHRRTFLLGLAATACTPTGDNPQARTSPPTGPHLLPGERLVAFARWPRDRASLTVYASGHLDYRTIEPSPERSARQWRAFRLADASVNDALRLTRHLSDAGFRNADRRYRGIKPGHEFNLYAPDHDRAVDLVWKPDRLPAAVTDAVSLLDDLRTHAAETGIDPFSNLAHRVVRPVLVHVHRRRAPDYSQVVSIFDNGALELRRIPASYSGAVQPWAASRRVRSGTMVELRGLVGAFDAERHPEPFVALGDTHELITARTQQSFRAIPSSAARALIERAERIVAPLDRLA